MPQAELALLLHAQLGFAVPPALADRGSVSGFTSMCKPWSGIGRDECALSASKRPSTFVERTSRRPSRQLGSSLCVIAALNSSQLCDRSMVNNATCLME